MMEIKQVIEERIKALAGYACHSSKPDVEGEEWLYKWVRLACELNSPSVIGGINNEPANPPAPEGAVGQPPLDAYTDATEQDYRVRIKIPCEVAINRIRTLVTDAEIKPTQFKKAMETISFIAENAVRTIIEKEEAVTGLDFGRALAAMREGKRVRRLYHHRSGILLINGRLSAVRADGSASGVNLSDIDLTATDWEIIAD